MKIGILGCGYVGRALASQWKNKNHTIYATTRNPDKVDELKLIVDHVHLLDPTSADSFVAFMQPLDALVICVAPDAGGSYKQTYKDVVEMVVNCHAACPKLSQIIYTSSTSVYGDHEGNWVDENSELVGSGDPIRILRESEEALLSTAVDGVEVAILRLGEIYGPSRLIEDRVARNIQETFPGDGSAFTNIIHLFDIVMGINFAIEKRLEGIYNLVSDYHQTRKELYETIVETLQLPPIKWDPERASLHSGNKRVSNQKIKNTGLKLAFPLWSPVMSV